MVAYAPALGTGPLDPALPLRFQGQGIAPSKLPVGELWTGSGGEWDPAWETKLAQTPAYGALWSFSSILRDLDRRRD